MKANCLANIKRRLIRLGYGVERPTGDDGPLVVQIDPSASSMATLMMTLAGRGVTSHRVAATDDAWYVHVSKT